MIRKILFTGCSFTWGQSLFYHGNFEDDIHPRDSQYYVNKILPHHYQYQVDNRFATQVADYFGRKPIVNARNGGDNWNIALQSVGDEMTDFVIVQTTAYNRSMESQGKSVKEQLQKFEEIIDNNEKNNIPVRFIHYGDLEEKEVPKKILDRTIYILGKYSFWEMIFKGTRKNTERNLSR